MLNERRLRELIDQVECTPYELRLGPLGDGWFLQARLYRTDLDTGAPGWGGGGKFYVSPHSCEGEVVRKCFAACAAYAEHEVREQFRYRGRRVFGPHIAVDALWAAAPAIERRRPPTETYII